MNPIAAGLQQPFFMSTKEVETEATMNGLNFEAYCIFGFDIVTKGEQISLIFASLVIGHQYRSITRQ